MANEMQEKGKAGIFALIFTYQANLFRSDLFIPVPHRGRYHLLCSEGQGC